MTLANEIWSGTLDKNFVCSVDVSCDEALYGCVRVLFQVIEIAFAALTFPVIKRFVDVFACTGGVIVIKDQEVGLKRLCETPAPLFEDCMDVVPDVACWSRTHHVYILGAMGGLVLYYLGSLIVRSNTQAKSSAVIIDGIFATIAFQLKVVLAVISSGWGDCHPEILLAGVEIVVVIMALMSMEFNFFRRRYSNVLELNAVRATGLLAAASNGLYALYITTVHGEQICNHLEVNDLSSINTTGITQGSKAQASFAEFAGLISINLVVLIVGRVSYGFNKSDLAEQKKNAVDAVSLYSREVDYQLVSWRLQVEPKPIFDLSLSEYRDEYEKALGTPASGQQIEEVTIDKVLFRGSETNRIRKSDFNNNEEIRTIHVKDFDVRTEGGHRILSKLEGIVEANNPEGKIARARQWCKGCIRKNSRCTRVVTCCGRVYRCQCKERCPRYGFSPFKMSVDFRRHRGALHGFGVDKENDHTSEEVPSPLRTVGTRITRTRAIAAAKEALHPAVATGIGKIVDSSVVSGLKRAGTFGADMARKGFLGLVPVPLLSMARPPGEESSTEVELLRLLMQVPDLTAIDISGCEYPLEQFIREVVLGAVHLAEGRDSKASGSVDIAGTLLPQDLTDLNSLTIDFRISSADVNTAVTIEHFEDATQVIKRIHVADRQRQHGSGTWDLSLDQFASSLRRDLSALRLAALKKRAIAAKLRHESIQKAHNIDEDEYKRALVELIMATELSLRPEHMYLLMGFMKMVGVEAELAPQPAPSTSAVACANSAPSTPPRNSMKRAKTSGILDASVSWAPGLHSLNLTGNRFLLGKVDVETHIGNIWNSHTWKASQVHDERIWTQMCQGLSGNSCITSLYLADVGLGPHGMQILVDHLLLSAAHPEFGQSLKHLDISKNPLSRVGKDCLANALQTGLTSLDVLTISLGTTVGESYQLTCRVLKYEAYAEDWLSTSFGGRFGTKNDIFASLSIDGHGVKQTSVVENAGESCVWTASQQFTWGLRRYQDLQIAVKDFDMLNADDLLGEATLELNNQSARHLSGGRERWLTLTKEQKGRKGETEVKETGRIKLFLQWDTDHGYASLNRNSPVRKGSHPHVLSTCICVDPCDHPYICDLASLFCAVAQPIKSKPDRRRSSAGGGMDASLPRVSARRRAGT